MHKIERRERERGREIFSPHKHSQRPTKLSWGFAWNEMTNRGLMCDVWKAVHYEFILKMKFWAGYARNSHVWGAQTTSRELSQLT